MPVDRGIGRGVSGETEPCGKRAAASLDRSAKARGRITMAFCDRGTGHIEAPSDSLPPTNIASALRRAAGGFPRPYRFGPIRLGFRPRLLTNPPMSRSSCAQSAFDISVSIADRNPSTRHGQRA